MARRANTENLKADILSKKLSKVRKSKINKFKESESLKLKSKSIKKVHKSPAKLSTKVCAIEVSKPSRRELKALRKSKIHFSDNFN